MYSIELTYFFSLLHLERCDTHSFPFRATSVGGVSFSNASVVTRWGFPRWREWKRE